MITSVFINLVSLYIAYGYFCLVPYLLSVLLELEPECECLGQNKGQAGGERRQMHVAPCFSTCRILICPPLPLAPCPHSIPAWPHIPAWEVQETAADSDRQPLFSAKPHRGSAPPQSPSGKPAPPAGRKALHGAPAGQGSGGRAPWGGNSQPALALHSGLGSRP